MKVVRWAAPAALLALVLLATGSASAKVGRGIAAQTFTMNVDQTSPKANVDFLAYFPRAVTVHPGDSVVFDWAGNGEPHTVTLGSLADSAVKLFNSFPPKVRNSNGPPPPAMQKADAAVPSLFPQGPGDATQSVANPCFQRVGPVGSDICPNSQHEQPAFDGRYAYYNSGWLDSGQKWTLHLSGNISPGTYRFMCALHREEMQGKITVVPSSKTVMTPAAQFALGQKQFANAVKPLVPAVAALRQGKPPVPDVTLPGANPVLAGSGVPNSSGGVDEFGTSTIKVPVGGTVTWWMLGPHSITFNSDKTNDDIRAEAPDGTVHINPKAIGPSGGPGEPPPAKGGPTKGINFKVVAKSSWDGQGFHNSGVFTNSFGPPLIEGYELKFTKAGTYHYICTVHDHMKGTVIVG